jgi:hypothetical protein
MAYGQAGSMLMYFQEKNYENPLFQYTLQMDREERKSKYFLGQMLKCSQTMHILVMLSVLILLLEQTRRVCLLMYLLGSIILGKLWFLVLFSCMMRHLSPLSGYLRLS